MKTLEELNTAYIAALEAKVDAGELYSRKPSMASRRVIKDAEAKEWLAVVNLDVYFKGSGKRLRAHLETLKGGK
jgi:hypothetical protein